MTLNNIGNLSCNDGGSTEVPSGKFLGTWVEQDR